MTGLMSWLKQEPTNLEDYLELAVIFLFFGVVWACIGFVQLGRNPAAALYERTKTTIENGPFGSAWKFFLFVAGEEATYRLGGLVITTYFFRNEYVVLACAAIISVAFGLLPPHNVLPMRTKVAVMLGGFILSLVYLKCGGWNGDHIKALLFATIAHLIPSGILTAAFEYDRRGRSKATRDTPRPP